MQGACQDIGPEGTWGYLLDIVGEAQEVTKSLQLPLHHVLNYIMLSTCKDVGPMLAGRLILPIMRETD